MSDDAKRISQAQLQLQVAEYTRRYSDYEIFAGALRRVLEKACKTSFPDAFVQARPKSIASFAEKAVRKFNKYPDAVNGLTDLCGARVIVQTQEQVSAVRAFVESNFDVREADEKALSLGEDKFGYRDMHYLIRLKDGRKEALGFTPAEVATIGGKIAELQVRTWVQHAWADTLHDRIYKTKLKYPAEFRRNAALLAAMMEAGDRAFNQLAGEIAAMLANFNAYAAADEVGRELGVQELMLASAAPSGQPAIAYQIARLAAPAGDYEQVEQVLTPHADVGGPLGCAIRSELGFALCKKHRAAPASAAYRQGQAHLQHVVETYRAGALDVVPDVRKRDGMLARALARLAWTHEVVDEEAPLARACFREALELEPANPYYLADVVGHEINYTRRRDFLGAMVAELRRAVATCRDHVRNGTEMPYAAFTAGRLHLLLDETDLALGAYARGIRHVLGSTTSMPPDVLDVEQRWLVLVTKPERLTGGALWAMDLLRLAMRVRAGDNGAAGAPDASASKGLRAPMLIVAGGADTLPAEQANVLRPMLSDAFTGLEGTVISGGTRVGVPGCVGEAAERVGERGKRPFRLLGYLPRVRPGSAPVDDRYDACTECGEHSFTAEQVLRYWTDIIAAGIAPEDVRVLGFSGGPLSAVEYQVALGLGACVGLIAGSGGAADALLGDALWGDEPDLRRRLLALPHDPASVRAFVQPSRSRAAYTDATVEKMGAAFHEEYVKNSASRLPANMKPWPKLKDTYRDANLAQARYAVQILEASGFTVRPAGTPPATVAFTPAEIEHMAELEHGRWNVERLRDGWRYGKPRDDSRKFHDCLVPWSVLPDGDDGVKKYDRQSVARFPEILAQANLEVVRAAPARGTGTAVS